MHPYRCRRENKSGKLGLENKNHQTLHGICAKTFSLAPLLLLSFHYSAFIIFVNNPPSIIYHFMCGQYILEDEKLALMPPLFGLFFECRYALFVQVVDMRWGVRDEATDDHMTTQLCMTEIDNCQRLSVGPNFVVSSSGAKNRRVLKC